MKKKIKKIINYCWFGNNKKSQLIEQCIESWKKYCPDYEIVEWNEKNFDVNINKYISKAYKQKKWAFVSDYARLWIIYNYGGIYLDTDVELIKKIPDDLLSNETFFCMEDNLIATGLGFGATKNNVIIKKLLDSYKNLEFNPKKTCVILNEPIFNNEFGKLSKNKVNKIKSNVILPPDYFCPFNQETRKLNITNQTIGIHWYGASWLSKKDKCIIKVKKAIKKIIGKDRYEKLKRKMKRENKENE